MPSQLPVASNDWIIERITLEIMWNITLVAWLRHCPRICQKGLKTPPKKFVDCTFLVEIRTTDHQDTNNMSYRVRNLPDIINIFFFNRVV
jgi:hypothetical protein